MKFFGHLVNKGIKFYLKKSTSSDFLVLVKSFVEVRKSFLATENAHFLLAEQFC